MATGTNTNGLSLTAVGQSQRGRTNKDRAVSELGIERPTYGDIDVSVPQDGRHGQEDCQDYQDLHRRLCGEELWKY